MRIGNYLLSADVLGDSVISHDNVPFLQEHIPKLSTWNRGKLSILNIRPKCP